VPWPERLSKTVFPMTRPTDTQLLDTWEQAYGRQPSEQALILLAACDPDIQLTEFLRLAVGERDRRLLHLRKSLFGDDAVVVSQCPDCSEQMEISISIANLILSQSDRPNLLRVKHDSWRVGFRVPSSEDLIAVQTLAPDKRRWALLSRCVSAIDHESGKRSGGVDQLPSAVLKAVVESMADADPQANLEFDLRCSECGHSWMAPFDIVSFLWREINDWAQRLMLQIHVLAKTYGWTQDDILALSRWRRQVYLGMARQ